VRGDGGDARLQLAEPTVASMLPDLDQLAGESIAAGIQNPDTPYQPARTVVALGPDGTAGSVETNTRLAGGQLASELVVSTGDTRGVASLKAAICPTEAGKVTGTIRLSIIGADDKERVSVASVLGLAAARCSSSRCPAEVSAPPTSSTRRRTTTRSKVTNRSVAT
jgi:hypothetical protein